MKKKLLSMLLAVCVIVSCFTGAVPATAEEEHEHEFTYLSCGYAHCWCGHFEEGTNCAWSWEIVSSTQHCKRCIYCNRTGAYQNHGWYTSGGSTYCESCGYPKP